MKMVKQQKTVLVTIEMRADEVSTLVDLCRKVQIGSKTIEEQAVCTQLDRIYSDIEWE